MITTPLRARARGPRRPRLPLAESLAAFGGHTALVHEGGVLSYAELAERVGERAARLGGGRRLVMIAGANHPETLVSYLAALRGGHVAWLVPDAASAAPLTTAYDPDVVVSLAGASAAIEERREGSRHDLHPELALLLGTSGSTGAPRLVRLSHANLQSNAEAIAAYLEIGPDERAVTSLPLHYCYGLSVVNSHLLRGARLLLCDRSVADERFWSLLREGEGTSFAGVPHTFELLDRTGFAERELPSLRCVTQAGGRLAPEAVRRYAALGARRGWLLVVMYGQTEATARMAYLPPELAAANPGAIGVPIPGGSLELRPVPEAAGEGVGELVYRGPNVMLGYAASPADLARGRALQELATGDLGRRTAAGLYEVVGRRSRFLKLFGLRVDLGQVERILEGEGVRAACAGDDRRLAVAVTGDADPAAVARLLAARLKLPRASVRVDRYEKLPLLASGKPDYAAIARGPEPEAAPAGRAGGVAEVFREVLGVERVGEEDTFAGLGGDSLSHVEASVALEELLGRLPPAWPEMPVRELAALERRPGRFLTRMETSVFLRAAAILLVVASHMTSFWPAGGAHLLLSIAGYNFARFQLAALEAPRRLARSLATVARIAVPTSAWIGVQVALVGSYSVGAALLVNNYTGAAERGSDGRWHYWFLEALVQLLLLLALLFSIPALRRLERRAPFAVVLILLGLALALRFELLALGGEDDNRIFRPHAVAWLFLLGWAAQRAATPARRLLVSVLALVSVPGFFGEPEREAVIAGGLLLLLWLPAVIVPRPLNRLIALLAAASLFVYLTHWQVFPPLAEALPTELALAATVAVGIAAWIAVERLSDLARGLWAARGRLRPRPGGPSGPAPASGGPARARARSSARSA